VGGDEEAEQDEQRGSDKKLRREVGRAVVVDVCAGRTAGGAAAFDHGTCAVRADQMLAAHLKSLR
jgi:hypothetical protein